MKSKWFPSAVLLTAFAIYPVTCKADLKRELSEIDSLCRCTGLQRKSGIQSRHGNLITVLLAADGVTEKYRMHLTNGAPSEFEPENYRVRWDLPAVQDAKIKRFCINRVKQLDKSRFSWAHFGKPDVVIDSPRGFPVRYGSLPPKKRQPILDIGANLYFLMTPKGTVCGVWLGE